MSPKPASAEALEAALHRAARSASTDDPRLDALAEGRLSPAEQRALEADATKDPELAAAIAMFRPLGDDAARRFGATAERAYGRARAPRLRRLAMVAAPLAAAAGLVLFLRASTVELPHYEVSVTASSAANRGGEPAASMAPLRAGDGFEVRLRPAHPVAWPLAARVLRSTSTSSWAEVPASVEVSSEGAVRIRGVGSALEAAAEGTGSETVELLIVVGPKDALEGAPAEIAAPSRQRLATRARVFVAR